MSNKSKSPNRQASNRHVGAGDKSGQPFEIKHRIAGAVVLMLVAIVVIPLLLSDPSVEANNAGEEVTGLADRDFKSRIVPLNIDEASSGGVFQDGTGSDQSDDQGSTLVNVDNATVIDDTRPALLDLTRSGADDKSDTTATSNAGQEQPGPDQPDADAGSIPGKTNQSPAVVMTAEPESEVDAPADSSADQSAGQSSGKTSGSEQPVEVASIEKNDVVKQGWVVRVGTFSKEENVKNVSTLLTSSGFRPKNTSVKTSLGPSTRVWLGPYAKRETADKISDRLKTLTGEKGYVTKTSS